MFYSQSLLSKGALRNIWVAAYFFKKLKKEQIADTDISSAIDKILPDGQISYRILAQLLLGIVKIFSKKVEFLYKDCHDTLTKVGKFSIAVLPRKTVNLSCPRVRKRVIRATNKAATIQSENTSSLQVETAIAPPSLQVEIATAPSQDFGITVPKRFELDSFDLQIEEEMEHTEHNDETPSKDTWTEDREKEHFLIERDHPETAMHYDSSAACFTPFDDVLPPDLMELDFVSDHANASSGVDPKGDHIQCYSPDIEECPNHESSGARRSLEMVLSVDPEHSVEVQECLPSENINLSPIVESIIHLEKEASHEIPDHEKYPSGEETPPEVITAAQGPASPKFTVTTPSKREQPRRKKRKLLHWDKNIVLSNGLLKTWIHDANDLVCKRRKAPVTDLDAWRARMFSKQWQCLSDPSISCISPDLGALFQQDAFRQLSPKAPSNSIAESVDQRSDFPDRPSDQICQPESGAAIDVSSPPKVDNGLPCEVLENEAAEMLSAQITDQGLDQMSKETGPFEAGELHVVADEGCSGRTRSVARFLNKRISCHEDQEQRKALSLDFILRGSTRSECARFFYETLTLKTAGCIDVSQSCAYGDIVVFGTPLLEDICKS